MSDTPTWTPTEPDPTWYETDGIDMKVVVITFLLVVVLGVLLAALAARVL